MGMAVANEQENHRHAAVASDDCAEGPERKIAYQPYPRADEAIFGFGYDNEPPELN